MKNISTHRRFIIKCLIASITTILLYPFKGIFARPVPFPYMPSWAELVDYARWCPTVHNLQPHKIRIISESEAELYYDPERLLPVEDPQAIFVTAALGIFHEHLSIAAAVSGYKVEMTGITAPVQVRATQLTLFALLKLVPATEKENIDRHLILKRKTSRLHFNGTPLQQTALDRVKRGASQFGHEFFYSSQREFLDYVIKLNEETLFEDLGSDTTRRELDQLFRYSEREAKNRKDGLWARCMGFPGVLLKSVFEHHEKWNQGIKRKLLSKHYIDSFKGTSTVCWFGGKFNDTQDWLNAGRMLARTWLTITEENAYIHPFGSLITNASAYKRITVKFAQPSEGKKIWMIFRAGYSKEPARSYRLATKDIIIT